MIHFGHFLASKITKNIHKDNNMPQRQPYATRWTAEDYLGRGTIATFWMYPRSVLTVRGRVREGGGA